MRIALKVIVAKIVQREHHHNEGLGLAIWASKSYEGAHCQRKREDYIYEKQYPRLPKALFRRYCIDDALPHLMPPFKDLATCQSPARHFDRPERSNQLTPRSAEEIRAAFFPALVLRG